MRHQQYVRRNVECILISTAVDAMKKTSTSTDVDCMQQIAKSIQNFSQVSKSSVKTHFQNLSNLTQISSDFEFAIDENSDTVPRFS